MTNKSNHAASGEGSTSGRRRDRGFSLIELVIVVTVVFVVSGIGVMIVAPALRHRDVELSARTVSLEMRRARQLSVDSRRQFRVTFTAPNTLLTERNNSGIWTAIRTTQLSGDLELYIAAAVTAGPDGFATGQAVNFSGASMIYFVPDGSAITAAGQVCNGVVLCLTPGRGGLDQGSNALWRYRKVDQLAVRLQWRILAMAIVTKAPPQRHSKGLSGSTGFGTVEVLAAFFVLTVALTSLLALMAHGVATMKLVEDDIIAKQKAREALESIYTSRNTAQITFDMINNTTTIPGIFLAGFQPLREANPAGGGGDGLIGTADDGDIEVLTLPGPDGLLGTGDDEVRPLDNFEREIRIDPILYVDLTVNPDVRRVIVSIRFHTPLGGLRTFQVESYISRFR